MVKGKKEDSDQEVVSAGLSDEEEDDMDISDDEWAPGAYAGTSTGKKRGRREDEDGEESPSEGGAARGTGKKASHRKVVGSTHWTDEEDARLKELVDKYGAKKWSQIADDLGTDKQPKQCRRRWKNRLATEFRTTEWTEEEDAILVASQKELGNKWTEIARRLNGRTDNAVKNRFLALQKKAAKGGKARKPVAARARADEGHEGGAGPRPPGAALGRGKPGMTPMEAPSAKRARLEGPGQPPGSGPRPPMFTGLQIKIPDDPVAPPPLNSTLPPAYTTPTPLEILVTKNALSDYELGLVQEINAMNMPLLIQTLEGGLMTSTGAGAGPPQVLHSSSLKGLAYPTPIGFTDVRTWLDLFKTPKAGPNSTTSNGPPSLFRMESLPENPPAAVNGGPGGTPPSTRGPSRLRAAGFPDAPPSMPGAGNLNGNGNVNGDQPTPRRLTRKARILSPRSPMPSPGRSAATAAVPGTLPLPSPSQGGDSIALFDDPRLEEHRKLTYRLLHAGLPSLSAHPTPSKDAKPKAAAGPAPPAAMSLKLEAPAAPEEAPEPDETWTSRRFHEGAKGVPSFSDIDAALNIPSTTNGEGGAGAGEPGGWPGAAAVAPEAVAVAPNFSQGEIMLLMDLLKTGSTPHGNGTPKIWH